MKEGTAPAIIAGARWYNRRGFFLMRQTCIEEMLPLPHQLTFVVLLSGKHGQQMNVATADLRRILHKLSRALQLWMRRSNNAGAMTPPKNGNTELVVACANPRNGPCQKHTDERLDILCFDMLPPSLQRKAGDGRGKEAVFQCCTSRTAAQQTRAPFPVMAFLRDNRNQRQCRVGLPS